MRSSGTYAEAIQMTRMNESARYAFVRFNIAIRPTARLSHSSRFGSREKTQQSFGSVLSTGTVTSVSLDVDQLRAWRDRPCEKYSRLIINDVNSTASLFVRPLMGLLMSD